MQLEQLQAFQTWFNHYVKGFYCKDPQIQTAVVLKEEHTLRVCGNIIRIGRSINLEDRDLNLAEAIALFHDVGRFRQFTLYRTFNDRRTQNHALLGLEELEQGKILSSLEKEEQELIKKAIEYHNLCDLPPELPERCRLFARLIRDADKLDILKVFIEYYARRNSDLSLVLESNLPDTPGYSPVLVENLLQQRRCSYNNMKNHNDRKLLLLSWIYDINFTYTLLEISKNGYLQKIIDNLPDTGDIRTAYLHLQAYMTQGNADTHYSTKLI